MSDSVLEDEIGIFIECIKKFHKYKDSIPNMTPEMKQQRLDEIQDIWKCIMTWLYIVRERYFDIKCIGSIRAQDFHPVVSYEIKPHLQTKEKEIVQRYKNECEKVIKIDKSLEKLGYVELCNFYLGYYKNPLKALEYAEKIEGGNIMFIDNCKALIIIQEKQKHFPPKW